MVIHPVNTATAGRAEGAAQPTAASDSGAFAEALVRAGAAVSEPQQNAARAIEQFTAGTKGELHETLMAVDQAEISLKFLVSVRNRLVQAYREVMQMGM